VVGVDIELVEKLGGGDPCPQDTARAGSVGPVRYSLISLPNGNLVNGGNRLVSRWKSPALLTVSSLVVLALAGCGPEAVQPGTPDKANPLQQLVSDIKGSLQKTMDNTSKATSASFTMSGTQDGEKLSGRGALSWADPIKMDMTIEVGTEAAMSVRFLDAVIYTKLPAEQASELGGKEWVKIDLKDAGKEMASLTQSMDELNPIKQLKSLLAGGAVTAVGEETVGGVKTVHYAVTMPVDTYLKQLDAKVRADTEKELAAKGVKEVKTDVWVDEQYQPRRVHVVMGNLTDMTMEYSDFGKPVTVEAPPASKTLDLKDMLKDLTAGS
jgi:hypothetical protein